MTETAETLAGKLVATKASVWVAVAARNHGFVTLRSAAELFGFDFDELLQALRPSVSCRCRGIFDDEVFDE